MLSGNIWPKYTTISKQFKKNTGDPHEESPVHI